MRTIPVYEPLFLGNEKKYLRQCIDSRWVSSEGYFVRKFEEEFAKWSGNKYAVAVSNGTSAIETAIWSTGIDSIYVPNSTIISCWNAPKRLGLCTYLYQNYLTQNDTLDENLLVCHLFGYYNNIKTDKVKIDDLSQYWQPHKVDTIGCYSLYANKLITCGEGGIVVMNSKYLYERARSYRNLCHSKERFVHNAMGYNFRMSNLQAAVALAQLERIDDYIQIKQNNKYWYQKYLPIGVTCLFNVKVPWMYLIWVNNAERVVAEMHSRKIECRRFFYPIAKQRFVNYSFNNFYGDSFWKHFVYLPSGLTLTEKKIKYICQQLEKCL